MLRINTMKSWRSPTVIFVFVATVLAAFFGQVIHTNTSYADGLNWMSGTLSGEKDTSSTLYSDYGTCHSQTVKTASPWWPGYIEKGACLFTAKSYRYAIIDGILYISVGDDQKMYPLVNSGFASYSYVLPSPETNDFVFGKIIMKDFLSNLTLNTSTPSNHYEQNEGSSYDLAKDEQGNAGYSPRGLAISHNGKWQVVNFQGIGLVRFNLDDMSATRIAEYTSSISMLGISNDGNYIAESSSNSGYQPLIYTVENCGQSASTLQSAWYGAAIVNPCPSRNISGTVNAILGSTGSNVYEKPDFSDDGGQLILYAHGYGASTQIKVTINSVGYTVPQRLDYLALGDSYSSGEGDTARNPANSDQKYYRYGTDVNGDSNNGIPREKCHISTRSYPYILANGMGLGSPLSVSGTSWQSVACSGARIVDVTPRDRNSDRGQGSRLKDVANYNELKSQALNEFIPGRVKQIEFVKKYKPKVITLTMGGNDVGFEKVLTACAIPSTSDPTCYYAKDAGKSWLARQILDRYDDLRKLYTSLYDASGKQAKIYVLGYPQFISSDEPAKCGGNIGALNYDERATVGAELTLMNNVIKKAASAAGVKYIDIEDSLNGGRLCDDGQKYITGVVGLPISVRNETQESFHPNAKAHFEIAMTVWDTVDHESLLDYDICPGASENACPDSGATKESIDIPSYLGTPATISARYVDLTSNQAKKQNPLTIKTDSYILRPQSSANITLHSDLVNLGDFTVGTDGSLSEDVVIPNTVPAGYHTLIVAGEAYSGEPVQYEQIVLVTGADPDDLDEDGINDASQPCGPFMVVSGQDTDLDGIDDACDPEISDTPQLYRVRQGDSSRTYNSQPEKDYYLYIERNTRASSITGINGDYDPDGDGWAIVGASQGKQYSGTSVPDTGPAANFTIAGDGTPGNPYQPIVSIRAGGWGCATYRPTSLGKVTSGQVRTFTRTAVNTDTCRQEPSSDDMDGNGQPDDTQPLYIARDGDSIKGEDPARIYLYRNFYSSEAQLGISDYTPTGTAANTIAALPLVPTIGNSPNHPTFGSAFSPIQEWNLLAVSKANEYIPAFNKLVMLQDSNGNPLPTVLTKKLNGQCIAYQPSNTGVVKFNQQNSLVKMAIVPGGVSCE